MSTASTEHLESHRQQILDAAQRCFVRNGLHGTSMEDVAAESRLPADTVSRHFETRDDLVGGIAANILRLISDFFDEIRREDPVPPLDEIVERFAKAVLELSGLDGPGRLAPIYWASALYNTQMAERARPPIEQCRSGWVEIAERERVAGRLAADADPNAVGAMLACLMPGILLQHILLNDVDVATFHRGVLGLLDATA
jgi:TetR/AcrR family transcriptional regulator, transcriptional repressor of aconitase